MFDLDHWREIGAALGANKVRTGLTAFGVSWGLFLLMVMLGSGNGLQNGVMHDFRDGPTNSFFLWSQSTSKPYDGLPVGRRIVLVNDDATAIRHRVPEARIVAPRNQLGGYRGGNNVTRGERAGGFSVMGDYPEIREIQAVPVERGRFLNNLDIAERRKVAVIGSRVREVLFEPGEDPIGENIRISGVQFKVVGVFRSARSGDDGDQESQTIYVPFTTFQHAFNYGNTLGWFAIAAQNGVPASTVEQRVLKLLAERHRVAPDDRRAFGHFNLEERYDEMQSLFAGISLLVWIVGVGTLAAGVIGVSNIMLVIVRERTKEIGLRRALGATPLAISGQILFEALLLTAVAGYVGLFAGVAVVDTGAWALTRFGVQGEMFRNPVVSLESALQALGILVVCGTAAGLLPAQLAVRVSPVEALRTE